MKRILLFLATNLAVLLVLSLSVHLLGLNHWLTAHGVSYTGLLAYCAVFGMGGAFISLALSKPMARWTMGVRILKAGESEQGDWLLRTVEQLSREAGIKMPDVGVYSGAPNAFATGARRNAALVAVSDGLLHEMPRREVEAVLAHEVAHVANGDMVTMALMQGVVNAFVMFLARVIGSAIDRFVLRSENEERGWGYAIVVVVLELVFGLLASVLVAAFSRHREYRADAGAAKLQGSSAAMIAALERLGTLTPYPLPKRLRAFGIDSTPGAGLRALLASHPSLEKRIDALRQGS